MCFDVSGGTAMKELSTSRAVPTSPPWAININKPSYLILKVGHFKYTRCDQKVYRFYYCKNSKPYKLKIIIVSFRNNALATLEIIFSQHPIFICRISCYYYMYSKLWNDLPFSQFFFFGNKVTDIWRALWMLKLSNGVHGKNRWSADQKECRGRSVVVLQPTTHRFHPWAQNAIIVLAGFMLLTVWSCSPNFIT